jgi:hypothetical protein
MIDGRISRIIKITARGQIDFKLKISLNNFNS